MKVRTLRLKRKGWRDFQVPSGSRAGQSGLILFIIGLLLTASQPSAFGQDAKTTFDTICKACHTIGGGRLVGPDLKDVTKRQKRDWLVTYMQNPQKMIDSGDPYAKQLLAEAKGVVMPPPPGMNPDLADKLLSYIEAMSGSVSTAPAGPEVPFTPQDVARGRDIFHGRIQLQGGGPACISCHTTVEVGGLGGGRLGPDLTQVYQRLFGRRPMEAWLSAPPTTTMLSNFGKKPLQPDEIGPLVAYFEAEAKNPDPAGSLSLFNFFLLGLGGTIGGLVFFDAAWRNRFRGVRNPLVHGEEGRKSE